MENSVYKSVIPGSEPLYQKYFEEALSKIDVQNFTNQTLGKPFDKARIESDYRVVEEISNKAKDCGNLSPAIIQVMLEQYFWGDAYMREMEKNKWIYRVMNRKDEDFFPDSTTVYRKIFT